MQIGIINWFLVFTIVSLQQQELCKDCIPLRRLHKQRYNQNNRRRYTQTERVYLHDGRKGRLLLKHYEYPCKPYSADSDNRTGRRNKGNAKASQIARQPLLGKAEHIRKENIFQTNPSCCDYIGIRIENAKQRMAEQKNQPTDRHSAYQTLYQTKL